MGRRLGFVVLLRPDPPDRGPRFRIRPADELGDRLDALPEEFLGDPAALAENDCVTFEVTAGDGGRGAARIRLLRDEGDVEAVRLASRSPWPRVWEAALPRVVALLPEDEAAAALGRWARHLADKPGLLAQIPPALLLHANAAALREQLPAPARLQCRESTRQQPEAGARAAPP
jgi:hypothetical protein